MEEMVNLIANYGVTIIIVCLFLWDWITNKKDMKDTSINISKSLDLLQKSMDRHDEKIDKLLENIK